MKLSLNWLKDYVALPEITAVKDLLSKVSLSVCEIESCESVGACLRQVVVSEVLAKSNFPQMHRCRKRSF